MNTRTSTTVTKALSILDLFLNNAEGLTVTKIANFSTINMSTAVRLCITLEKKGYLQRNNRGVYFVGPQIEKLAQVFRNHFNLEDIIRPALEKLCERTGESASFYVIEGKERVCLFREDSKHQIRHVVREGARLPLNRGVVGPLLMAFSGAEGNNHKKIRENGYYEAEGRETYTASVAVPVFESGGKLLVGALVVSGPAFRFDFEIRREAIRLIMQEAVDLQELFPQNYQIYNASA